MRSSFLLPAGFFVAGTVSLFALRQTETRWQILTFVVLIGVMAMTSRRISFATAAASAVAVTAGILLVKFSIEGWPI